MVVETISFDDQEDQDLFETIVEEDASEEHLGNNNQKQQNGNRNKDNNNKSKKKRNKKKKNSADQQQQQQQRLNDNDSDQNAVDGLENVEIEFVPEEIQLNSDDPSYAEFVKIFEKFKFNQQPLGDSAASQATNESQDGTTTATANSKLSDMEKLKARILEEDDDEEKKDENKEKISKKKLKKLTRLSVAALKQLVTRPDVVEMHDVTARDPKLLVDLKSTRNTVQVSAHWCAKRQYLQGKRGFEKPAFDLPDFIKRTGIQTMREVVQEKEASKSLKQKMREKVRPKMGKIDIDYQKLHDAFFRYQTKPRMTLHGDLYYEGKEFETRYKQKKPGNMSDDLRIALGMPIGAGAEKTPPPWLIAMQRYGPPPSYPSLKIPGLNAPIPDGCSFGYHAGGWGKPPVDEFGRPLYGDVFGSSNSDLRKAEDDEQIDQTLWGVMEEEALGEMVPDEDEDEEEDEAAAAADEAKEANGDEDDEEMIESDNMAGLKTPGEGLATPSGISTTVTTAGLETPDMIELRKRKIEAEMESSGETPVLYKVLPEKSISVGGSMMGSSKIYDVSAAKKPSDLDEEEEGIDIEQLQSELVAANKPTAAANKKTKKNDEAAKSSSSYKSKIE